MPDPTMSTPTTSREWQLVRRPSSAFHADDVALVEVPLPSLTPEQVLVANTHLSVDPYMRGRMDDTPSYIEPFRLHAPLQGGAIGVVVESRSDRFAEGDVVEHFLGLRDTVVADAAALTPLDLAGRAPQAYLGALGSTGLTAWVATTLVAPITPGDTVLVTGAAGAVGSLAGQLARLRGAARVVGTAGSADKCAALVDQLAFDAAVNYRDPAATDQLRDSVDDGIDVVVDNAGGAMLEVAIDEMSIGGRIALVGMASEYDGRRSHAFRNLYTLIKRRVRMEGLLVTDHVDQIGRFRNEVGPWLDSGHIVDRRTAFRGLESFPEALHAVLTSGSALDGKAILDIA